MKKALLVAAFVAQVLAVKACLEWLDGANATVVANDCCEDWVPCPGREPIREGKHRLVWYCARPLDGEKYGPPVIARESAAPVDSRPAKGRSEKRAAGGRGCAARGG